MNTSPNVKKNLVSFGTCKIISTANDTTVFQVLTIVTYITFILLLLITKKYSLVSYTLLFYPLIFYSNLHSNIRMLVCRVAGELRDKALEAINTLILSPDAPEWSFEIDTEPRIGARDYVISSKRKAYSELEQDSLVEMIDYLALQVDILKAQNEELMTGGGSSNQIRETNSGNSFEGFIDEELDEDSQVKTALVLSAISIALWGIAILALFVKFMGSGSGPNATPAPGSSGMEASFN